MPRPKNRNLSVQAKPSGIFYIRGTYLGQTIYESTRTRDPEQARLLAAKLEKEIFERHLYGRKSVATFDDAAAGYLGGGKDGTYLIAVIEKLGDKKLREITQAELDAAARAAYPDASDATRLRQFYTPFIAVWNYAVSDELCEPRKWRKPPAGPKRIEWRRPEEMEALLKALNGEPRDIVTFYLGTGARASEAIGLEWRDVSLDGARATLWEENTKAKRIRHVDMADRATAALPPRREEGRVFRNHRTGEPWHAYDAINIALRRACERAGIRHTSCHMLRHTWATWAYAVTRDLDYLMKQGGWQTAQLAMRYIHAGNDDLARAVLKHGWDFKTGGHRPGVILRAVQ